MTEQTPTDTQQYPNVASQCAATATSELAKNVLVDDGSGTLRELLNDAADAIPAGWGTPAPVGVEPAKRQYYYKVDGCPAGNSESPNCICWHDEGTGPRATADPTLVSWRGADQVLAMGRVPLTEPQIDAAAKALAECMDYPWEHMPEKGRQEMRKHAQAVLYAAHGSKQGGQHGTNT